MNAQSSSSIPMDTDTSVPSQPKDPKHLRVFEIFSWENVQSNLSTNRPPSTRIPPASDQTSAFLDVQKIPNELDGRLIAEALPEEAIGSKFRADTNFIQIFFDTTADTNKFIQQGTLSVRDHNIPILPPKGKLPQTAYVRLDNVPIRSRATMEKMLKDIMAEFCLPVELAPLTLKGTKLMTSRWEMMAQAIPEKNLTQTLPPIIEVNDQKVLLSWPGAPLTCLQCLSVGHNRKNCPKWTRTAPVPKQATVPPKQKKPLANKNAPYADAVKQKAPISISITPAAPEHSGNIVSEDLDNEEYQGTTGLYDDSTSLYEESTSTTQMPVSRPSSPSQQDYVSMDPEYMKAPTSSYTTSQNLDPNNKQVTKKRHITVSPSGSPQPLHVGNIMNFFTNTKQPRSNTPNLDNQN